MLGSPPREDSADRGRADRRPWQDAGHGDLRLQRYQPAGGLPPDSVSVASFRAVTVIIPA